MLYLLLLSRLSDRTEFIVCLTLGCLGYVISQFVWLPCAFELVLMVIPFLAFGRLFGMLVRKGRARWLLRPHVVLLFIFLWISIVCVSYAIDGHCLNMAARRVPLPPLPYIAAIAAFFALYGICGRISRPFMLGWIGQKSLMLMLVHAFDFLWYKGWSFSGRVCKDHRHLKMHQGVFIDIFPLDEPVRGCKWLIWRVPRMLDRLTAFTCANLPDGLKMLRPVQMLWQKLFLPSQFARMANAFARLLSGRSGVYMSTFCTNRTSGERKGWDKTLFDPPRRVSFEGVQLNVPNESEKLLEQRFGDWNELPPEQWRWPVHGDGGVVDINCDYHKYMANGVD